MTTIEINTQLIFHRGMSKTSVLLIGFSRFDLFTFYWHKNLFAGRRVYVFIDGTESTEIEDSQIKFINLVDDTWKVVRQHRNLGLKKHIEFVFEHIVQIEERVLVLEDDVRIDEESLYWVDRTVSNDRSVYLSLFNPISTVESYRSRIGYIWGWVFERWMWTEFCDYKSVEKPRIFEIFSVLLKNLGFMSALYFTPMTFKSLNNSSNSWAYGFFFWRVTNNVFALTPSSSLSENIGFGDTSATHTTKLNFLANVKIGNHVNENISHDVVNLSLREYLGIGIIRLWMRIFYNWVSLILK